MEDPYKLTPPSNNMVIVNNLKNKRHFIASKCTSFVYLFREKIIISQFKKQQNNSINQT
jgi:hypothetical protein